MRYCAAAAILAFVAVAGMVQHATGLPTTADYSQSTDTAPTTNTAAIYAQQATAPADGSQYYTTAPADGSQPDTTAPADGSQYSPGTSTDATQSNSAASSGSLEVDATTLAALNDNGYVNLYPTFEISPPEGTFNVTMEPNESTPNVITFVDGQGNPLRRVDIVRSSTLHHPEQLMFTDSQTNQMAAIVTLKRNLYQQVDGITIQDRLNGHTWTADIDHSIIGRTEGLTVERNWDLNNKTQVKFDHDIWGNIDKIATGNTVKL